MHCSLLLLLYWLDWLRRVLGSLPMHTMPLRRLFLAPRTVVLQVPLLLVPVLLQLSCLPVTPPVTQSGPSVC